jgi:hypothetical protein
VFELCAAVLDVVLVQELKVLDPKHPISQRHFSSFWRSYNPRIWSNSSVITRDSMYSALSRTATSVFY